MLLLIFEIEEEKERENIDVREKHPCVASCMRPNWELNLQTFEAQDDAPTNWVTRPGLFNTSFEVIFPASFFFIDWLIWMKEQEKHWLVFPLICAFVGWFLSVPWPGIKPATLVYQVNALTKLHTLVYQGDAVNNWATQPGHLLWFSNIFPH